VSVDLSQRSATLAVAGGKTADLTALGKTVAEACRRRSRW